MENFEQTSQRIKIDLIGMIQIYHSECLTILCSEHIPCKLLAEIETIDGELGVWYKGKFIIRR